MHGFGFEKAHARLMLPAAAAARAPDSEPPGVECGGERARTYVLFMGTHGHASACVRARARVGMLTHVAPAPTESTGTGALH